MDDLTAVLTVSVVGMLVTMFLLGALGMIFYIIGRYETNVNTQRKGDEPYVAAAVYFYLTRGARRSADTSMLTNDDF